MPFLSYSEQYGRAADWLVLPGGDVMVSTGLCGEAGGIQKASTVTARTINANENLVMAAAA